MQTLELGRQAVERKAWEEAWSAFNEADREQPLSPGDLELLADAAFWAGHPDESVEALERAYAAHIEGGDPVAAATDALLLAYLANRRLALSIASGWQARAERLLDGLPESAPHAFLRVLQVVQLIDAGSTADAAELAQDTVELARRTGNREAETLALVFQGYALVASGRWKEGLALIDEATAAALAGDLSLRSASDVFCVTIATCRSMADFRRAGEWTEQADRWMSKHAVGGYPGVCQVHRAELKRLHGAWGEAEEQARNACLELERYRILDGIGPAHYEVGEVRLHMGDLDGAEASFQTAFEHGFEPQPGLALLMLARGNVEEAARELARILDEGSSGQSHVDLLTRARLLPAQVEVALARDDAETARHATEELEALANEFERPAFRAAALTARGETAFHEGDTSTAIDSLEQAIRLWREIEFPYETAKARVSLGAAHLSSGDTSRARMELAAARSVFERLGAPLDLKRVEEMIYRIDAPTEERSRVVKTFMFTDIVTSTDLVGMMGDAAWESLLEWHDRELRAAFAAHGGVEVIHTGDGFFVAFDRPGDAVEAAVAIQRRLAEQRRDHGFSPSVRVGMHTAEATLAGGDYRGQGVHLAARVGAVAGAGEIVVSDAVVEAAGNIKFPVTDPRSVELKGIAGPVQVSTVRWQ